VEEDPKAKPPRGKGRASGSGGRASSSGKALAKSKAANSKLKEAAEENKQKLADANAKVSAEKTRFRKWRSRNPDSCLAKEFKELMKTKLSPKVFICC
jgi:predicted  nucleic acid-binding Zn-ribbon protein